MLMHGLTPAVGLDGAAPGMIVAGVGAGLVNVPLATTAVAVVEPARAGMASGVNSTFRQVGIATGIAALGAIFSHSVGPGGDAAGVRRRAQPHHRGGRGGRVRVRGRCVHADPASATTCVARKLEHDDLGRREQPQRQAARPEPRGDVEVAAVLDRRARGRSARRSVTGSNGTAEHRDRHLPAVRVPGQRQRDARGHVAGRRQGRGRAGSRARRPGLRPARPVGPAAGCAGRRGRRRGCRRSPRHGSRAPRCRRSASARHISSPACFQSWLPSTANVPSGARSFASSRAIASGGDAPAPQRVGVDVVAEQQQRRRAPRR